MSLLRKWLSRITHRVEVAKDRVAVARTGHCRHRTHAEMIAARDYCPDCRRRYVAWAESAGLGFNLGDEPFRGNKEWVDIGTHNQISHSREWAGRAWDGWEKW